MKPYVPEPLPTDSVSIPPELIPLAELMARNVHEVWARNRMADGWTYGPERRDDLRQHPCLVPYDDLPEREKDYDRDTSLETLRFILAAGFKISR